MKADKPGALRQTREQRLKIQITITDVKRKHSVASRACRDTDPLPRCQKMRGHRVGAECIHDQQSIFPGRRFAQSQTRVAENHPVRTLRAIADKRKIARLGSNTHDRRIDVVESPTAALATNTFRSYLIPIQWPRPANSPACYCKHQTSGPPVQSCDSTKSPHTFALHPSSAHHAPCCRDKGVETLHSD
jgi:hypothetical protein